MKLGFIFEEKYKKDPRKLTRVEIDNAIFGKRKATPIRILSNIVSVRGNIFQNSDYGDIDVAFQNALKG